MDNVTKKAAQVGMTGLTFEHMTGIPMETAQIILICTILDGKLEVEDHEDLDGESNEQ